MRRSESGGAGGTAGAGGNKPQGSGETLLDDRSLKRIEREHVEGLTAAQIVEAFTVHGMRLSEATFRKWVQLGLLPRSRRVGRKGKHQGSLGLYPPSTVRRINQIKRLMGESLTIEEIGQSLQFREEIEGLERGFDELTGRFRQSIKTGEWSAQERSSMEKLVEEALRTWRSVVAQVEALERRIVTPLERAAKQRAFGAGSGGGADELL